MSSSFWNAWLLLTSLKACDCSGHIVGGSASPTSLTKKLAICHPLPLFMAVSMIPNMWPSSCDCMRHSWSATKFEVIRLNQLVVRVRRWRAGTGVLVWERSSFPGKWFANIFFPVARIFFFERSTYEDQEFQVPHKPARAGTMKSQGSHDCMNETVLLPEHLVRKTCSGRNAVLGSGHTRLASPSCCKSATRWSQLRSAREISTPGGETSPA